MELMPGGEELNHLRAERIVALDLGHAADRVGAAKGKERITAPSGPLLKLPSARPGLL
jgi:hypothetical protein